MLDSAAAVITEKMTEDEITGERYVALNVKGGISFLDVSEPSKPGVAGTAITADAGDGVARGVRQLNFVPYYFRANRGGGGQMRVGLRRAIS